jgi:hypothetical protein
MNEGTLTTIEFHGSTLFAAQRPDGVFVAINPICDALGLAANKQKQRIQSDPILGEGGTVTVLPSAGGPQETFCLRLDLVHGWLFTIDESRVKDETIRQRVLTYKRECYAVLFRHFYEQASAAPVEDILVPRPWSERPLSERNTDLRTIDAIGHWGNPALAWWYLTEVVHIADFPRHLLPAWQQQQSISFTPAARMKTVGPAGDQH